MKKIFLMIGFISVAFGVMAQKSNDFGVFLGMTQRHLSSILPIPDSNGLNYAAGGYYRYSMNPRYSWRGGANVGFDRVNWTPDMVEAYGFFEFNFHPLSTRRDKELITSYISVGLSYLVDLRLLNDIIPDIPAPAMREFMIRNIRVPFNVGVRYNATSKLTIGLEWAIRKGYELDYSGYLESLDFPNPLPEPKFNNLISNWRSHVGVTIGYMISNYCRTCPFYENERKKLK
jgi:hypothetical protein